MTLTKEATPPHAEGGNAVEKSSLHRWCSMPSNFPPTYSTKHYSLHNVKWGRGSQQESRLLGGLSQGWGDLCPGAALWGDT